MITIEKKNLINECLRLSRDYPNKTVYGFISKRDGYVATLNDFVIRERIFSGDKVYIKAINGNLTL